MLPYTADFVPSGGSHNSYALLVTCYILLLLRLRRVLGPVLGAATLAVLHTLRVEGTTDDVVAAARQVLHAATADKHHRVLLEVVTFARNVSGHFHAVG